MLGAEAEWFIADLGYGNLSKNSERNRTNSKTKNLPICMPMNAQGGKNKYM